MLWKEAKEGMALLLTNHCSCLREVRQTHAKIVILGIHQNAFLASLLLNKYCSFSHTQTARLLLDSVEYKPGPLLWNSMIRGYFKNCQTEIAMGIYRAMDKVQADKQTFHLVIKACAELSEFAFGMGVHECIKMSGIELDAFLGTAQVGMYCKSGQVEATRQVFDFMLVRDVVAWNAMICGYLQNGLLPSALELFSCMLEDDHEVYPTETTLLSLISVCGNYRLLKMGESLCTHVVKIGLGNFVQVGNSIIEMYIKCKCVDVASTLFERMQIKDVISWNSMIAGYSQNGRGREALVLFHRMVLQQAMVPTRATLLNLLPSCAETHLWQEVERIMQYWISKVGFEMDASLGTALITVYSNCKKMDTALKWFRRISKKDVITWNSMIKAYADLKQYVKVFHLLHEMQCSGIHPDHVTLLTLLTIFVSSGALGEGMEVHAYAVRRGYHYNVAIAHALMDMYAKCGNISTSRRIFEEIRDKDVVSWTVMISGYAFHGDFREALSLFALMRWQAETAPNDYTFTAVLTACNHGGLVDEGRELFRSMREDYCLKPRTQHYACLVDLLCRVGLLTEAYVLAKEMPMDESSKIWGSILSGCRVHCNLTLGKEVAECLFYLEPINAANYILLASIYVTAGKREEANKILSLMKGSGLTKKQHGVSWIGTKIKKMDGAVMVPRE